MVPFALKLIQAGNVWHHRSDGELPDGRNEIFCRHTSSGIRRDDPAPALVIELRGRDPCAQLDVAAQVVAIGDMVEVAEQLGLLRIFSAPRPLAQEILVEGEAIDIALGKRRNSPQGVARRVGSGDEDRRDAMIARGAGERLGLGDGHVGDEHAIHAR